MDDDEVQWFADIAVAADAVLSSMGEDASDRRLLQQSGVGVRELDALQNLLTSSAFGGAIVSPDAAASATRALQAIRWTVGQMGRASMANFAIAWFLDCCRETKEELDSILFCANQEAAKSIASALKTCKERLATPGARRQLCSESAMASMREKMSFRLRRAFVAGMETRGDKERRCRALALLLPDTDADNLRDMLSSEYRVLLSSESSALDRALQKMWPRQSRAVGAQRVAFELGRKCCAMAADDAESPEGRVRERARKRKRRQRSGERLPLEFQDASSSSRSQIGVRQDWVHYMSLRVDADDDTRSVADLTRPEPVGEYKALKDALDAFAFADVVATRDDDEDDDFRSCQIALAMCDATRSDPGSGTPPSQLLPFVTYKSFFERVWFDFNRRLLHDDSPWRPTLQRWMNRDSAKVQCKHLGDGECNKLMSCSRFQRLQHHVAAALLATARREHGASLHLSLVESVASRYRLHSYASPCIRAFCKYRARARSASALK